MPIRKMIESARFPVYKSGGYQVDAVDELLTSVIEAASTLESDLESKTAEASMLSSEVVTIRDEVAIYRDRVSALEAQLAEIPMATVTEPDNSALDEIEVLRGEISALRETLVNAEVQAKSDEEHIEAIEAYADEVEKRAEALRVERDKIKADAEVALASLVERLRNSETTSVSYAVLDSPVVEESFQDVDVFVQENELEAHELPTPLQVAFSAPVTLEQTIREDDVMDSGEHVHTPSITTPTSTEESVSEPTRPRLLRRS